MPVLQPRISFINKFVSKFEDIFSKKQLAAFRLFLYALFFDYKRLCLAKIANNANLDYQRLQYFFSDSNWDEHALNDVRLKFFARQKTTSATNNGVLAIDDTACPKPHARKTEGAAIQHCAPLNKEEICNVAVASCFVSQTKHFPVNFKSYMPKEQTGFDSFKSKLELAMDLIDDALAKGITFSRVVVDSWYTSKEFIEFVDSKGLDLIAEVKSNRCLHFYHPIERRHCWIQQDELVILIESLYKHKLKPVRFKDQRGKDRLVFTYSFKSNLKGCNVPVRVVVSFENWSDEDDKRIHILITNNRNLSSRQIVLGYLLRWGIEQSFRELKDSFCFDQYQVRHQKQIQRHWMMSLLAWSLAYWVKQNGCLSKILEETPITLNGYKEAIGSLIIFDSTAILSKNRNLAIQLSGIKSKRFKDRLP